MFISFRWQALLVLTLVCPSLWGQLRTAQVRIPAHPGGALFRGEQGKQRTEINFDPASGTVTVKLLVQDTLGFFIPNIRRENFKVYDNGVAQKNASVDIEHAPASILILIEHGGWTPGLSRTAAEEASHAGHQFVEHMTSQDRAAAYTYSDKLQKLADFSEPRETLATRLITLAPPELSPTNLYDALVSIGGMARSLSGLKGILLISSGVDTLSKASKEDAMKSVRDSGTALYALGLSTVVQNLAELQSVSIPSARVDWKRAGRELMDFAKISGGRAYFPPDTIDLSPICDDLLENLKVRYVIRYKIPPDAPLEVPRTIRVELVDPKTGGPVEIVDSNGKIVRAKVVVEDNYVPEPPRGSDAND